MGRFDGQVVLITGGTTGIGLTAARLFHAEGARVVVTGRDADRLGEARAALPQDIAVVRADSTRLTELDALFRTLATSHGHVDVLFANAGVATFLPVDAFDEATFDAMVDTNLKGTFFTVQRALPLMREGGRIVLNTSVLNAKGVPGSSVLGATKAALRALVRTLAAELAPRHIRVNAVSPGPTETPLYAKFGLPPEALQQMAESIRQQVPMGRFGQAEEVARVALFLASADSSFVTGVEVAADGGMAQV